MKKFFETPEIEVQAFAMEDVITASGDNGDVDLGDAGLPIF